jgi:DNA-binding HxlR family transcriptional regulator
MSMDTTQASHSGNCSDSSTAELMQFAIHLLGDEWTLRIVVQLLKRPMRFNELREALDRVSPKTLSQRLKGLQGIQLVERRAFCEIPPRVEYHLTNKGIALGNVIGAIEQFAHEHLSGVAFPSCH